MSNLQEDLVAHHQLARRDRPDASVEEIVTLIAGRMGIAAETELALESASAGGDVDVIRQFVYEMEEPDDEGWTRRHALHPPPGTHPGTGTWRRSS